MKVKHLIAATAAFATIAGLAVIASASGAGAPENRATTTCNRAPKGFDGGQRKQVDPIVAPGAAQSAHLHDFQGRVDISPTMYAKPYSRPGHENDPSDIAPAYTNCLTYGDWAAYWAPTAKFNGVNISPGVWSNTWQAPAGASVVTPPFGMTFVSGNAMASQEGTPHVAFTCGNIDVTYPKPQDCTASGGVVTAQTTFPDCWDGTTTFDVPAGIGMSHFYYSTNGVCPPGTVPCPTGNEPPGKLIAQLVAQETFIDPRTNAPMVNPNNADGTLGLSFASGPYYTYHADFLNTWNHILQEIVDKCLNHTPCPSSVTGIPIQ